MNKDSLQAGIALTLKPYQSYEKSKASYFVLVIPFPRTSCKPFKKINLETPVKNVQNLIQKSGP